MFPQYNDIRSRISKEPIWFDCNGVPRYDEFHPDMAPNIYARQVVLLWIQCQSCEEKFYVEMNAGPFGDIRYPKELHYGDPPFHEDRQGRMCSGSTMNCDDLMVSQVWDKVDFEWVRRKDLEGMINGNKA